MKKKLLAGFLVGLFMFCMGGLANATLMDYSFYTNADEYVGYFSLNDNNLVVSNSSGYLNTIIEDVYFEWNGNIATFADVDLTGYTYLGYNGVDSWVTGGGDNLTGDWGQSNHVWIAGTSFIDGLGTTGGLYGYWITTESGNTQVPEPTTMLLLGFGLLGLGLARRKS